MIILGNVCDNTCFGYVEGDNSPDYLALFGPVFGNLIGRPFTLDVGATGYALTINGHTLTIPFGDPHYSISFTSPLLSSFSPGTAVFTAIGANPFGIAMAETEYLCPAVPEPATWALMLIGFIGLFAAFHNKRRSA